MKPEDFSKALSSGLGGAPALGAQPGTTQRVAAAAPLRGAPRSDVGLRAVGDAPMQRSYTSSPQVSVPLAEGGVMPGNTRVDHAWTPSREATAAARHALPAPTLQQATLPPGGGQKGQFVGWKSN